MMKMPAIAALWLALPVTACAGPYVELGISAMNGCVHDFDERRSVQGCSNNPFGLLAVGYELDGWRLALEHRSSLVEKDPGINAVTLTYRWEFK